MPTVTSTSRATSPIARGEGENAPLEMTKWFDSNYHYLVPEIGPETAFRLASDRIVREFAEAKAAGFVDPPGHRRSGHVPRAQQGRATRRPRASDPLDRLDDLLPVYAELLARAAPPRAPSGCSSTSRRS